ncbi:TPA: cell envelope integrity protein TolA [Escherichia coli]
MKFLDDIITSLAGNAKTKINDPFVGAFIFSWLICNWNHLSLLFWGEGKISERINLFYEYISRTPILGWNELFVFPFLATSFYLFIFPWFSLFINIAQGLSQKKLHKQAIDIELVKIKQQQELNKERLRTNPNKQFLEQLVQQDIDKRKLILEHIRLRGLRLEAKAIEAKRKAEEQAAIAQEAKNKESISNIELDKKNKQAELERIRFESDSAKARAVHASNRFPSAYYLMLKIDESLRSDNIHVSLKTLGLIVSSLFGYANFNELLNDKDFNNNTLSKVKYVYYDDELAKRLEQIVLDENSDNEDFSADLIFEHLERLFEGIPFKLISGDHLAELCREEFENNPFNDFDGDGISGAIAESDTVYEDVDNIIVEHFDFNNGFYAELSANVSGQHYKEEDVPGRDMTVSVIMQCNVFAGKFGLGPIEQGEIKGTLNDMD